jgi:hypothetical protein
MALQIRDRVLETTTTTGTGDITLAGAVAGFQQFSAVCSVADTCYYMIEAIDSSGTPTGEWESGLGTYSALNTLTRTTVNASSNSNAAVTFSAGTKRVGISAIAAATQSSRNAILSPFTTDSNTWANTTGRQRITKGAFPGGFNRAKIAFQAASGEGLAIAKVYIGVEGGTSYSFLTTPTEVKFGGGTGFAAIAIYESIWSDEISLSVSPTQNVVITWYVAAGATANDSMRAGATAVNGDITSKSGDDAITQTPAGYSASGVGKNVIASMSVW